MSVDLKPAVKAACSASPWDLGNKILYDLCKDHPLHSKVPVVLAKIWLVGRSYAAAIERRRGKEDQNDDFYVHTVAPSIISSDIDRWIAIAAEQQTFKEQSFDAVLAVHANVTRLFSDISGLEKRSLASKYLHFHLPKLFYIYDTRAVEAMRLLSSIVGRVSSRTNASDNEYRKFSEKCRRLQMHIHEKYKMLLTPRQVDNLLLYIHAYKA